ncbi:TetR/AcrR family transcriptional regulator [Mycolicibacterium fluoranthenivorans]|uniref:AcrR family transcriptional regulator n=1 Tax=Mycolicibacterium fluoranthenivorans TaxID=258505 RepID=A0A7X5TYH9_9MYCO|nr:TetR/AcrR family transcriptional regulator [Mycolicibacterium fluoranthenivorans]MCV7356034.1 TetR/AcrR family transcriptional regulator [Mycolicibacterium fluoranthenivorans]NIH95136.1 AcrR family transcriptional regulator [Mycolicibacterium fluoranthenivorans]
MRSPTDRRPAVRSDMRREAILDALDEWLRASSLETVNIAEIAKQAGVSRSAFYFYFENKAAAVAALMERIIDEVDMVNTEFVAGEANPRDRVNAMLDGLFDTCDRYRHVFAAMLEARGSSAAVREIWDSARESFGPSVADLIAAQRHSPSFRSPLEVAPDPRVLALVLLEFNDRLIERFILGGPLSREELTDAAAAVWLSTVYGVGR